MTDNEIILTDSETTKALECCSVNPAKCNQCPLDAIGTADCFHLVIQKNALDLINRQKAEIDRLTLEYAGFKAGVKHFADIGKMYSEVRAEAIREFEDKFLDVCQSFSIEEKDTSYFIWADDFAKIIKEMTEDKS